MSADASTIKTSAGNRSRNFDKRLSTSTTVRHERDRHRWLPSMTDVVHSLTPRNDLLSTRVPLRAPRASSTVEGAASVRSS